MDDTDKESTKSGTGSLHLKTETKSEVQNEPPPKPKGVELIQDDYGTYYDEKGVPYKIYRFTWTNRNRIEVQVITYGARIISIKYPNKFGIVQDVLLGYDKLSEYVHDRTHHFGAILGRFSTILENGTFVIDGVQHWVTKNADPHHKDGGNFGFDKKVWNHYVADKKVILSYVSPNEDEGYPGDLFVKVTYELTSKNEFSVDIEAFTTKTTVVNITNELYFNLAGHNTGPSELQKHTLNINANCFLVRKQEGIPTGEIKNVVHTEYDMQIPIIIGKVNKYYKFWKNSIYFKMTGMRLISPINNLEIFRMLKIVLNTTCI